MIRRDVKGWDGPLHPPLRGGTSARAERERWRRGAAESPRPALALSAGAIIEGLVAYEATAIAAAGAG